jgi:hypothetical protein
MPLTLDPGHHSAHIVGQPILAAAGFQSALAGYEDSRIARKSRLKGGCGPCRDSARRRLEFSGKFKMNHYLFVVRRILCPRYIDAGRNCAEVSRIFG